MRPWPQMRPDFIADLITVVTKDRQHTLNQGLHGAAAAFFAKEARLDDTGVVEDQQIPRAQLLRQVFEDAMYWRCARGVQQTRGAALAGGVLCNQLGGQVEVKVRHCEWRCRWMS